MRINKLAIDDFKNLSGLSADFDEEELTTVVVGKNGTGKSNLLEALILIFRHLDLGERPPFKYRLEYMLRDHKVYVDADPARSTQRVKITVDGERLSFSRFSKRDDESYLPSHVFGYYSGFNDRMEAHFQKHQERFYDDLIANMDEPLRPLFYARLVHSQFTLLAFFNEEVESILEFLCDYLRIEGLDHVLFVMREPNWENDKGDVRFWNAEGTVEKLLGALYETALAPLRITQRVPLGLKKHTTKEHLYLFLEDKDALKLVSDKYRNQRDFFKALESTYISELISEVKTRVNVEDTSGSLTFRDLSEGEQQLLMVLGLLRFTQEQESLFILDEPDTHLNPAWAIQYLELLDWVVGDENKSQIIMATHNPLVVASLERSQVLIMRRDEEIGHIRIDHPEQDPRGMGVASLLTSDVYSLRSQLDPPTLRLLDKKRELAIQDQPTSRQRKRLAQINEELEKLHFTDTDRDPLYELFVEAMAAEEKSEGLQTTVLTEEQRIRRRDLAERIVRRLRTESQEKR
jgi:predicted ATPase